MSRVKAYWHQSDNFGDRLTPYIIEKLTGDEPEFLHPSKDYDGDCFIITGSILSSPILGINDRIWGAGVANIFDAIDQRAKFHAVRGPITLSKLSLFNRATCEIGDPGLLLPKLYKKEDSSHHCKKLTGVIASWVDSDVIDIPNLIKAEQGVEQFVDAVCSRHFIASSTLHGLITAIAYGIPCKWVTFGDRMMGDGTKFRDFFQSIGYMNEEPEDWSHGIPKAWSAKEYKISLDLNALIEACPIMWPERYK